MCCDQFSSDEYWHLSHFYNGGNGLCIWILVPNMKNLCEKCIFTTFYVINNGLVIKYVYKK